MTAFIQTLPIQPMNPYFVALNGQQQGPFAFAQLQAMLNAGQLNLTDLCWREGMPEWQPISTALPSLLMSPKVEAINPYAPPKTLDMPSAPSQKKGYYGGIGRLAYVGWSFGLNFIAALATTMLPDAAFGGILFLGLVVGSIVILCQRLKNIGMSAWMALLAIVPIANIWIGYRCLACQEGYQDIGQLDKAGRIVTWILGIIIALVIGSLILTIAFGGH